MSDTKKPTTSAPLLGGHMGGAGETRTVHVKNFPSTPEAKQCPNYCASCICDQTFGGQRPLCPVHDAQRTGTTTTASSPDQSKSQEHGDFVGRYICIIEAKLKKCEAQNAKMREALQEIDAFRSWYEHEHQADIAKEALSSSPSDRVSFATLQSKLQECEAQNKKMREALEAIGNARYHKDISDMYATSVVGGGQLSEQIVSDLFHDILWRVEEYETIARASLLP